MSLLDIAILTSGYHRHGNFVSLSRNEHPCSDAGTAVSIDSSKWTPTHCKCAA